MKVNSMFNMQGLFDTNFNKTNAKNTFHFYDKRSKYSTPVPSEEVSAISGPVIHQHLLHRHVASSQDGQPGQHRPNTILLTNVITARSAMISKYN